jgi:hypothetical protein
MLKYRIGIMALFISIFILFFNNSEASSRKFKVLLVIPPTAERALASETKSYITRELRALQDVEQIDKDPTLDYFLISIYPVSLNLSNGQRAGIAVSYVFDREARIEHSVLVGGPNELKTLCEKIVAYFDTYWLGLERKGR